MSGLRMFDQAELAQLIGGEDKLIDMDDLEKFAHVSGYPNDKTIKAFWKVVKSFNQEQRRGLVKFVTSCARPPLYVFSSSSPPAPLYTRSDGLDGC
jgi:ubiquitin-protein ligase E3 C